MKCETIWIKLDCVTRQRRQVQAGGNMSGYVKFTLSKEMMPDSFNVTDRRKGDCEHAGDILEWIAQAQEDVAEDEFDRIAAQRGWAGQARDHTRFSRYLFTVLAIAQMGRRID